MIDTTTYERLSRVTAALARRMGETDTEEAVSASHLWVSERLPAFEEGRDLTAFLYCHIRHKLRNAHRVRAARAKRVRSVPHDRLKSVRDRHHFPMHSFLADLGEDACTVVKLSLFPPPSVEGVTKGGLYKALRDMGWSVSRILKAFEEVRLSLA